MSLANLVGISLETITPSGETVRRLLEGAARHIADARVREISAETRYGSACRRPPIPYFFGVSLMSCTAIDLVFASYDRYFKPG